MKEYRFNEAEHIHELKVGEHWKPLIGVTSALQVIAKPQLIQWAANMAVDYIRDNSPKRVVEDVDEFFQYIASEEILKEARVAHRKKKEEAGKKGTDVHKEIENLVAELIASNNGVFKGDETSEIPQIQKFIDWAKENKVKFFESEKHVFSESLWIGGILDMVIELDGKKLIADVKTSSGIYNEAFFQMGAYDLCLEEMGEKIDGYLVINLKKTGEFDLKIAENTEINRQAFLSALSLYKIIQSIK